MERFGGARGVLRHPAQYVALTFVALVAIGTALLLLPVATRGAGGTGVVDALFTATSAACVTGLVVLDTPRHWSGFGQVVLLVLMQVGGLGIMTLSSAVVLVLSRRLGLRQRVVATETSGSATPGDLRALLAGVVRLTLVAEAITAVLLAARYWSAHDETPGRAVVLGVFHAVSSFNNAGFMLWSDGYARFREDPVVLVVTATAVFVGGLGFPVWVQLARHRTRVARWDLHTKLTMATTTVVLVAGWAAFTWFEWSNARTLGPMTSGHKVVNGLFQSTSFRSSGMATVDTGELRPPSQLLGEIWMFIGGGSASTAGGIKVTTFALLGFVMWAEVRGDRDVEVFRRRVPIGAQRQALTVALMAVGGVMIATLLLLATSDLPREDLTFEAISALGTVGLSTGITPELPAPAKLVVTGLMFLGRVGPPTLFAALVLRERQRLYRHPEERPLVG